MNFFFKNLSINFMIIYKHAISNMLGSNYIYINSYTPIEVK